MLKNQISPVFMFLGLWALTEGQYCPESYGVQTYPHEKYCDKFYLVSWPQWFLVSIVKLKKLFSKFFFKIGI